MRLITLAFVVLAAVAASLGLGGGAPVVIVAAVVVAANQRGRFASLRRGERAPLRRALVQTWWAPIAGLLGVTMVAFGFATVFEAHNWGGRIFGSGLLMAFGLAMLFGLSRRPFDRQAGNSVILVATIPSLLFFWMILPAVAAIVVWIGVLRSGFSDQTLTPATP
jgi:hypothetical protein